MKPIIAGLAALASSSVILSATVGVSPASAQHVTAGAPAAAHVTFADLDLSTEAGVSQLKARVEAAAHNLCDEAGVQPLDVKMSRAACFKATYSDGLNQVQHVIGERRLAAAEAATKTGR